jgi:hypothetical protein
MATKIVTKNSSTASAVPTASDLVQGELAVNVADKRLFTEDNGGSIVELGTNPSTIDINAGTIDGAVIGGTTPAAITGSTVTSTGNIVVTGTVDGRDVATDGTKLDGIEAGADVTDTTNVTAAGALMDSEVTNLAQVKAFDSADYATAAQGATADAALPKAGGALTGAVTTNSTFDGRDVATDGTKLDGIEVGATADQTAAEIKTAYESNADTNAFTDADNTKLAGIEASADVTDTANVTAAGAVMDSELTSEASVKALNQGVATTDSPAFAGLTVDTDTLAVDSTNNRVGIGTATPSTILDVKGAAARIRISDTDTSGTTGIEFVDSGGTKDAEIEVGNSSQYLTFKTNGSSRLTIDGSGKVGIGTSSPSQALTVDGTDARIYLTGANTDIDMDSSHSGQLSLDGNAYGFGIALNASGAQLYTNSSSRNIIFGVNETEKMRIGSNNVTVGTVTSPADLGASTDSSDTGMATNTTGRVSFASNNTYIMTLNRYSSNGAILRFAKDGVVTGSISTNANSLPSDRNFKKNILDLALGLDFVNSLSPKTYNFNIDDEGQPVMTGLIAQEVEAALTAAGVEHNSMTLLQHEPTENVNDSDYQMDYVKFVPILINSIKEQQTLIDSLTARITALENN